MRRTVVLAATALALLGAPAGAAARPADSVFAPRVWPDARDAPGSPLDIRAVSFGERDTQLWLTVRSYGDWPAGADVCLTLLPGGRICASGRYGAAQKPIPGAVVSRSARSVTLRFHPRAAGLRLGRVRWAACAAGCADRAPERGYRTTEVGALGAPRCFGAAARAGARPCTNPALGRTVTPSPSDALLMPDGPCRPERPRHAVIEPCDFGDLDSARAPAAALIGDSHSAHLRGAVEVVAQARGWHAVSITHAGCAFSTEVYTGRGGIPATCRRHGEEALRWLRAHPSVHSVFTSASAGRGFSPNGFAAMWRRVPATVHRIYVIRDVPRVSFSTAACVRAVIRRHARPDGACAVARAGAFPADPARAAAAGGVRRVRLIDLTRYFCDAARCYPVVGGAYVYKDDNHINAVFAATLGPFLLRRVY